MRFPTLTVLPTRGVDFTTYSECLHSAVKDLGTATPHIQVVKLIAWLFSVSVQDVKTDCRAVWLYYRQQDISRG